MTEKTPDDERDESTGGLNVSRRSVMKAAGSAAMVTGVGSAMGGGAAAEDPPNGFQCGDQLPDDCTSFEKRDCDEDETEHEVTFDGTEHAGETCTAVVKGGPGTGRGRGQSDQTGCGEPKTVGPIKCGEDATVTVKNQEKEDGGYYGCSHIEVCCTDKDYSVIDGSIEVDCGNDKITFDTYVCEGDYTYEVRCDGKDTQEGDVTVEDGSGTIDDIELEDCVGKVEIYHGGSKAGEAEIDCKDDGGPGGGGGEEPEVVLDGGKAISWVSVCCGEDPGDLSDNIVCVTLDEDGEVDEVGLTGVSGCDVYYKTGDGIFTAGGGEAPEDVSDSNFCGQTEGQGGSDDDEVGSKIEGEEIVSIKESKDLPDC